MSAVVCRYCRKPIDLDRADGSWRHLDTTETLCAFPLDTNGWEFIATPTLPGRP